MLFSKIYVTKLQHKVKTLMTPGLLSNAMAQHRLLLESTLKRQKYCIYFKCPHQTEYTVVISKKKLMNIGHPEVRRVKACLHEPGWLSFCRDLGTFAYRAASVVM